MAREALSNDIVTTLVSAITGTPGTMSVVSNAGVTGGQFRVRIDDEYLLVSSAGTTTWTIVTRGIEGSTAVNHAAGAEVALVTTAGGLQAQFESYLRAPTVGENLGAVAAPFTSAYITNLVLGAVVAATVFAGPITGANAAPAFRVLTATDLPSHTHTASQITDLASAAVAFSNKTGNISQWTNNSGYITSSTPTPPAGPINSIQFNLAGAFGGTDGVTYDSGTQSLLFVGNIPDDTNPITVTGGDDGFGDAALVFGCADDFITLKFTSFPEFVLPSDGAAFVVYRDNPEDGWLGQVDLDPGQYRFVTGEAITVAENTIPILIATGDNGVTESTGESGRILLQTGLARAGASGVIRLQTGGVEDGTGGNIELTTAVPSGSGVRGALLVDTANLTLSAIAMTVGVTIAASNLSGTNTGDQDLSGYVQSTRTVNGHALSANVSVTASDLSLGSVENAAASGLYVPLARTVNGHALSANVSVTAADVGLGSVENAAASALYQPIGAYLTSVTAHALLSATHSDTTAGSVARGDVITGQGASATWKRLAKGTANQVLAMDGTATDVVWATVSAGGGGDALVANPLSQFAATTSLQLKAVISDETGSGALVFATGPAFAGELTHAHGTITTALSPLTITETRNASGVTFPGIVYNVTDTFSAAGSLLIDLQRSGSTYFGVKKDSQIILNAGQNNIYIPFNGTYAFAGSGASNTALVYFDGTGVVARSTGYFAFTNSTTNATTTVDTWLYRGAQATIQMGANVNGAAIAQAFGSASGITGTDKTGANFTLFSGPGTGAGVVSSLIFQTPTVLGSGTAAQSLATRLTINALGLTIADAMNIVLNTTTGTMLGTGTTQKLGHYGATPVVQGASVADATGGAIIDAEARAAINALISRIEATGLIATV